MLDPKGRKLTVDSKTGNLVVQTGKGKVKSTKNAEIGNSNDRIGKVSQDEKSSHDKTRSNPNKTSPGQEQGRGLQDCYISIEQSPPEIQVLWDDAEARTVQDEAYITGTEDRFIRVCKVEFELPHHQHTLYRQWLIETVLMPDGRTIQEGDLPITRGTCMPPGMGLPKPTGQA